MRIFISADIEGITGVVHGEQCSPSGGAEYTRARLQMTKEVNAAARGFFAAGATQVVVNDSHGSMRNIYIEELDPRVQLLSGSPKHLSMMEGINADFDAVAFVGYHAKNGDFGVLSHTISGGTVHEILINGEAASEAVINAAIAGDFKVPVIFLSGDQVICEDIKKTLPNITTAQVKEAVTRYSALHLPLEKAEALIESQAQKALENIEACQVYIPQRPVTIDMVCHNSGLADNASRTPGTKRIDGKTVRAEAPNFLEAFKLLRAMIALAN
ncbi:MAG: M55 family metallopeptidase [Firmicutes bacterium]|jgi:D-amino peptidase|nr:M55 family metallopeptidase [Bacillota bacterium]